MQDPLFDIKTLLPAAESVLGSRYSAPHKEGRQGVAPPSPGKNLQGHLPVPPAEASTDSPAAMPAWVHTDYDIVQYFAETGDKTVKFFYCSRADQTCRFAPYDLVVVTQPTAMPEEHFTVSPREVLRFSHGQVCETLPLTEWVWQKQCYNRLRQKTFFRKYYLAKYYRIWWKTVRQTRLHRTQRALQAASLLCKPAFCSALLEIGSLLVSLRSIKACSMRSGRVYRLSELVDQQANWRDKKARPEVEDIVGRIRKAAERACGQVEQRAREMRDSVKDPAELEDRIGVDLHASTTAARAKSMWVIKQEKISKARAYHQAMAEVRLLPAFLRLVDAMLAQALAVMAVSSLSDALRTLEGLAAPPALPSEDQAGGGPASAGAVAAAAAGGEGEGKSPAGGEKRHHEGAGGGAAALGALFVDVHFAEGGTVFRPSQSEWVGALEEQLVEGTVQLAGDVAPLASLPVFLKYQPTLPLEEGQPGGADGGSIARGSPDFHACCQSLRALLEHCYADATTFATCYEPHRKIYDFNATFDLELRSQKQRGELDLAGVRRDLGKLQEWRAQLDRMRSSAVAGCIQVDARALKAALEPMATGALDQIKAMLLQLARELCRERLEDIHLRLHVARARPAELEDFVPWKAQVAEVQAAKDTVLKKVAAVDDCYDVLLLYGSKIPTTDQVKHDDLKESVGRLMEQVEACGTFIAEQTPGHREGVRAAAKGLIDEAILAEEALKNGMYVDETAAPEEVVADLEAVVERIRQMRAAADDLRSFQQALGLQQDSFSEVEDAHNEAQARLQLWSLLLAGQQCEAERARQVEVAERRAAVAEVSGAASPATESSLALTLSGVDNSLANVAAEVERLEGQLSALEGVDCTDPVWRRARELLAACRLQSRGS